METFDVKNPVVKKFIEVAHHSISRRGKNLSEKTDANFIFESRLFLHPFFLPDLLAEFHISHNRFCPALFLNRRPDIPFFPEFFPRASDI